jgi:hypothetical protein
VAVRPCCNALGVVGDLVAGFGNGGADSSPGQVGAAGPPGVGPVDRTSPGRVRGRPVSRILDSTSGHSRCLAELAIGEGVGWGISAGHGIDNHRLEIGALSLECPHPRSSRVSPGFAAHGRRHRTTRPNRLGRRVAFHRLRGMPGRVAGPPAPTRRRSTSSRTTYGPTRPPPSWPALGTFA